MSLSGKTAKVAPRPQKAQGGVGGGVVWGSSRQAESRNIFCPRDSKFKLLSKGIALWDKEKEFPPFH